MKKVILDAIPDLSALVRDQLEQAADQGGLVVRIGVPGGRSAAPIIQGLRLCSPGLLSKIKLYLVDERLEGDRNEDTLLSVGFGEMHAQGLMDRSQLVVPHTGLPFLEAEEQLDLVYLGVGEDGHIASLFPGSFPALDNRSTESLVTVEESPKPPLKRVTMSYRGFRRHAQQAQVHLLFLGEGKRQALVRFLRGNENAATLPCAFFPQEWFHVDVATDLKEIGG